VLSTLGCSMIAYSLFLYKYIRPASKRVPVVKKSGSDDDSVQSDDDVDAQRSISQFTQRFSPLSSRYHDRRAAWATGLVNMCLQAVFSATLAFGMEASCLVESVVLLIASAVAFVHLFVVQPFRCKRTNRVHLATAGTQVLYASLLLIADFVDLPLSVLVTGAGCVLFAAILLTMIWPLASSLALLGRRFVLSVGKRRPKAGPETDKLTSSQQSDDNGDDDDPTANLRTLQDERWEPKLQDVDAGDFDTTPAVWAAASRSSSQTSANEAAGDTARSELPFIDETIENVDSETFADFSAAEWLTRRPRSDRPISASTNTLSDMERDMIIDDLESIVDDGYEDPYYLQPDQ